ncbi:hypothetical protein SAMN06309944_0238 [Micrococcales bacterium KH10]|nr:hypothetical protein SAMN06309944_0238 [Micrococcales bacterium KH10]
MVTVADEVLSTDDLREAFREFLRLAALDKLAEREPSVEVFLSPEQYAQIEQYADEKFNAILTTHDAEVRRDEREKVAREIETVADSEPQIIGFHCTFPGPRESGLRAAARIARGGAS